jgi:hypothetical protein
MVGFELAILEWLNELLRSAISLAKRNWLFVKCWRYSHCVYCITSILPINSYFFLLILQSLNDCIRAVISKLFEPRHNKCKLKHSRHTSQVSFKFFAPNLVFLVIDELNLWLNLTQNSDFNTIESLRHFSRLSKFFWLSRHTVCGSLY